MQMPKIFGARRDDRREVIETGFTSVLAFLQIPGARRDDRREVIETVTPTRNEAHNFEGRAT